MVGSGCVLGSRGGDVVGRLDPSGLAGARLVCDGVQRVFGCGKRRALGCIVFGCALARVYVRGFCGPCRGFCYVAL